MSTRTNGVPHSFEKVTLDDFTGHPDIVQGMTEYITNMRTEFEGGKGILFVGPPGVGKTMLACVVLNAAAQNPKCRTYFIELAHYQQLLMDKAEISRMMDRLNRERFEEDFDKLTMDWFRLDGLLHDLLENIHVLVLDDVGKEYATSSGFVESKFDYLVRRRSTLGLITIMTSNLLPNQWAATYSESMHSFIHQVCHIVEIRSTDHRQQA